MSRRGFSLVELLVAMAIMGILGIGLVRIIVNNSRFVSQNDAMMEARETARAAMLSMLGELHMVGDRGLVAATRDSITVRLPYTFGMACQTNGGITVVTLMPTDSLTYATAVPEGLAWRDSSSGAFTNPSLITGITVAPSTNTLACTQDSIRQILGSRLVGVGGIAGVNVPPSGSLLFLYQTVTYKFAASADVPGRRGLWRKAGAAAYEEVAAPFDSAAAFAYLTGPWMAVDARTNIGSQAARDSVRGVELRIYGSSVPTPEGRSAPETFRLRTRVAFMNKGS
jgi:prepilin-type N-terminal cleavage/methylation domain-containing protein